MANSGFERDMQRARREQAATRQAAARENAQHPPQHNPGKQQARPSAPPAHESLTPRSHAERNS